MPGREPGQYGTKINTKKLLTKQNNWIMLTNNDDDKDGTMTLNASRIDERLAEKGMGRTAFSVSLGMEKSWLTCRLRDAEKGVKCQPATIGRIARGLGATVQEIVVQGDGKNGR